MQTGRIIGISVSERYGDQFVPLKFNGVPGQFFSYDEAIGNLTRKTHTPTLVQSLRRRLLAHFLDYLRSGHKARIRKSLQHSTDSEKMVGVAVRGINRGQVLAALGNPIDQ